MQPPGSPDSTTGQPQATASTGTGETSTGATSATTSQAEPTTTGGAEPTTTGGAEPTTTGGTTSTLDGSTSAPVVDGGTQDGATAPDADTPAETPTSGPFPPVTDTSMKGPYETTTRKGDAGSVTVTVYEPTELAPDGAKNPIVAWMSGGGTTHDLYGLLPHLASHGFVVVAPDVAPGIGAEVALGQNLVAAIDWAIAQAEDPASDFFEKLDTTKVASSGYSMGSLATFTIADDPRLTTTLHISGGNMMGDEIDNVTRPAAFICGTPGDASCNILSSGCDIAGANCDADFVRAKGPLFYANFSGGHLGILTPGLDTQISEMATAWLRYQLMGDTTLARRFVGDSCTYCSDMNWKVQQKNLQ